MAVPPGRNLLRQSAKPSKVKHEEKPFATAAAITATIQEKLESIFPSFFFSASLFFGFAMLKSRKLED